MVLPRCGSAQRPRPGESANRQQHNGCSHNASPDRDAVCGMREDVANVSPRSSGVVVVTWPESACVKDQRAWNKPRLLDHHGPAISSAEARRPPHPPLSGADRGTEGSAHWWLGLWPRAGEVADGDRGAVDGWRLLSRDDWGASTRRPGVVGAGRASSFRRPVPGRCLPEA